MPQSIDCPKQGIMPHDMIHHVVEDVLGRRGFLGLVAEGRAPAFTTQGSEAEASVERLVEVLQAEMWGGRVSVEALIDAYHHACAARGHGAAPLSAEDVDAVRARIDTLAPLWAALPVGKSLALDHPG